MGKECWARERHMDRKRERKIERRNAVGKKKKSGRVHQEESQELQVKGTGDSTAVQAAAGQGHTCLSPSPGSPPGALGCFGKQLLEQPWSLPGLPGMHFCNTRSRSHQVWDRPSLPRACHCPCHPPPSTQPEWFSLPSCPRLAGSEGTE